MWLKKLHTLYVTKANFNTIVDTSIQIISNKTGKQIDQNDKIFFETFNAIASQVFSVESKNQELQKKTPEQAIQIINGIVIEELVNYILSKKPDLLKEPENRQINKTVELMEETVKLSIENMEVHFNSPIEKITQITIESVHMYTQDYLITELNNTLVIIYENEEYTIQIQPGNYTVDTLLKSIQDNVFLKTKATIEFILSDIDNTLILSQDIKINEELSTLDTVLGISKKCPVKLIKRNKVQFGIKCGFENEMTDFELSIPLIINSEASAGPLLKEFKLNYTKKFRQPVDLTDIKLDFDKYNHRGYPFYLMLNITRFV
jgi:hypothetical protein